MGSESGRVPFLLSLLALLFEVACQNQQPPANATQTGIVCNNDFLRSYMLKGYEKASTNDTFVVCTGVNATCCSKRDQLYIFHYLGDVLPQRMLLMDSKRNTLMGRLKRLHRRILNTNLRFEGNTPRDRFCSAAGSSFTSFNFNEMYSTFEKMALEWREKTQERLSKFYCALCDANNHKFFSDPPRVTVNRNFCKDQLKLGKVHIQFWSKTLMDYLKRLQQVVDCNHYETSFNLTFFQPLKLVEAADAMRCLEFMDDEFDLNCHRTCARLGLASMSDFLDGDLLFLERAINIFEKFNFNREAGQFHSIKMRRFNQKWQELREITLHHVNGTFRNAILNATAPVDVAVNPLDFLQQQLSTPLPRQLHLMSVDPSSFGAPRQERRLSLQKAIENALSSRPPSDYELQHRAPSHSNSVFMSSGPSEKSDSFLAKKFNSLETFFQHGRRLQALGPTNNTTSNGTNSTNSSKPARRTPKVSVNSADYLEYDSIVITKKRHESDFVLDVFLNPINIDSIPKILGETGVSMDGYSVVPLDMEPFIFHKLVFNPKRVDGFSLEVEQILSSVDEDFEREVGELLVKTVEVSPKNYFLKAPPTGPDGLTPIRRGLRTIRSA